MKCSERTPDYSYDVLVTDGRHVEVKWWDGDEWDCLVMRDSGICSDDVTHWMLLPEPPEA
ncbi:TPA_asm: DUF551 domain-containing protein [Salmonella enterica subsp. enterica serovar Enteritidis]|uniref:DUF551 domain-containing protein n=1 Tax=Salmonella enteritidis TaxID=149539 RepID=A0A6X7C315_SALEN|nr:DUF551 domain-containing protein [Salmonella enterica subsp. enterica serovar Enteritidis]